MRDNVVCALVLLTAACGNGENNATSNNTANHANTNNASTNNASTNNANTNNASTNNASTNHASTNNASTNNTPVAWLCDDVTPAGPLTDAIGTWAINSGCIAVDPYGPVYQLCPGAVVTKYEVPAWGGFFVLNADNTFVQGLWADGEQTVFMPQECVGRVGAGDCPSIQTILQGVVDRAGGDGNVVCAEAVGGCLCDVDGRAYTRNIGTMESSADGMVTLHYFANDGSAEQSDWTFAVDASQITYQDADDSSFAGAAGGTATACEVYCTGFVANCHGVAGVTEYDDYDACLASCAGLTVAGTPQTTGDSLECRTHHLFLSADPSIVTGQTEQCPNAQLAPTGPCVN